MCGVNEIHGILSPPETVNLLVGVAHKNHGTISLILNQGNYGCCEERGRVGGREEGSEIKQALLLKDLE